jgi:hypothetical protein
VLSRGNFRKEHERRVFEGGEREGDESLRGKRERRRLKEVRDFEQKMEVDGSRSLDFLSFSSFPLSSSSHLAAAPAAVHLREELGLAPGGGLSLVESIGAAAGGPGPEQGAEERRRRRRRKRGGRVRGVGVVVVVV